jgi:UDP-arabinose 4-epimerase
MSRDKEEAVLVTGGAGYVGSHACKALARAGYIPVTYDNLAYGHREAVRWGPLLQADLADRDALAEAFRRFEIKAVMHFAASANVSDSLERPELYYRNNVINSLILLDCMRCAGVRSIVFSSSAATYGNPEIVPIHETTPQRPVNPYGETKLAIERALHWYGSAYGIAYIALRYFNASGADPDAEIGEVHRPETHLIPLILETALGRRSQIEVYGTNYLTDDGTAVRDYIHVQDLADAHVRALDHLRKGGGSIALNLGAGQGHSVLQVIAAAERITGRRISWRETARRPGDPPILVADTTLVREVLNWTPQLSDLYSIIKTAWSWHCRDLAALPPERNAALAWREHDISDS